MNGRGGEFCTDFFTLYCIKMPNCCKTASVESVNLKNVIQGNVGNKLKSIARSLANRHVPTIEEIMEVGT